MWGFPSAGCVAASQAGLEPMPCKDGYIYTLWAADTHYKALKTLLHDPPGLDSEVFDKLRVASRTKICCA